jgi:Leucine-rich repeat (LRR) protein
MSLYLGGNRISDLAPLAKLTRLSSLSLPRNQIRDLGPLASVHKLMTIDLSDNEISDLTPLTKQTEVTLLMLERNKITDLTPLLTWAKADAEGPKRFAPYLRLYLGGNPLSEAARTEQLKALKSYVPRVEF